MSLPPDFATHGLHISRASSTPITRFQVLGERASGTNFVKRLLGRNSHLTPSDTLGWKHGFVHMAAVPPDMAVICVVRAADTWTRSMFTKPWHTSPHMQSLPFSAFLRAEWSTIIDRPRYFQGLVDDQSIGMPLQHDRDPATGHRFENLFALRRAKLTSMLTLLNRDCTCIVVRMETAQSAPKATRDTILNALDSAPPPGPFRPVVKRLGSKFKPAIANRPDLPDHWSDRDRAFLNAQTDTPQEASLGYVYP